MTDCYLDNDGAPEVIAVEADGPGVTPQALWVRVGPVFDEGGTQRKEPGIWISYQEGHMKTPLAGPVLLTPAVWYQLAHAVDARIIRRLPLWRRVLTGLARGY